MIVTEQDAVDQMLALFHTMWSQLGHPAHYPNTKFELPDESRTWARIVVQHAVARQSSLTGGLGKSKYKSAGTLFIQLFTPVNVGADYALCNQVTSVYVKAVTEGCIWFKNVRINEIGQDGAFYQTNVVVDFSYEMVK